MAMAGIHHGDAGGKIDIAAAFLVPDLGIFGAIGIDLRRHADTAGNGGVLPFGQGHCGGSKKAVSNYLAEVLQVL
ncbi:hypothetical protein RHSP_22855 [Rhizobium freirei PRF 81]|uniref:Uncharacterized protein n=1 Tax=Rhizobium freirei PRF 81 TaxID=363754 RepID=N6U1Z5_9HYPH|nr:hypothetical protein RHSP_22855 [Rhizobium freirei PRF 81]